MKISSKISIPDEEIVLQAVRSQGSGGQNVNKQRLLALKDRRLSDTGVIVIKAQEHRSQEKNKEAALKRLKQLILAATAVQKKRRATKPTRASRKRRLDSKTKRGKIKSLRGKSGLDE